jgi:hypothetical protein
VKTGFVWGRALVARHAKRTKAKSRRARIMALLLWNPRAESSRRRAATCHNKLVEKRGDWTFEIREASKESDFGIQFWQAQGPSKIFEAAWQMVIEAWTVKGRNVDELRLQRTAVVVREAPR